MHAVVSFFNANPILGQVLRLLAMIVLAIVVVTLVLRFEKKVANRLLASKKNINLRFVESIVRFVVILIAAQWVVMSSPITSSFGKVLFQGTAIISAIAGFAAQPVIADIICGLMLSATKPFDIGDRIELEDGTSGIVVDITLRHVVLKGVDTVRKVIPNNKLNAMTITNMSYHTRTRSIHFRFNVSFDTDVNRAMKVIGEAVQDSPFTIPGKPGKDGGEYGPVYFISYADSSLVMATTVYFSPDSPSEAVISDVNLRVLDALRDNGIEIPYNYIHVVTGEHNEAAS